VRGTGSRTKESGLAHCGHAGVQATSDPVESSLATREPEFEQWVCERLERWPTMRIVQFEGWLQERGVDEFVPAVHEALRRRGIEAAEESAA
jgi:hypothetical protein